MQDEELVVRRAADVHLQPAGAAAQRLPERGQRVLLEPVDHALAETPVRDDGGDRGERPAHLQSGHRICIPPGAGATTGEPVIGVPSCCPSFRLSCCWLSCCWLAAASASSAALSASSAAARAFSAANRA